MKEYSIYSIALNKQYKKQYNKFSQNISSFSLEIFSFKVAASCFPFNFSVMGNAQVQRTQVQQGLKRRDMIGVRVCLYISETHQVVLPLSHEISHIWFHDIQRFTNCQDWKKSKKKKKKRKKLSLSSLSHCRIFSKCNRHLLSQTSSSGLHVNKRQIRGYPERVFSCYLLMLGKVEYTKTNTNISKYWSGQIHIQCSRRSKF